MKIEEIYNVWKSLFPLSEKQTELLRKKFTAEYNYNSNHIEGNTLSLTVGMMAVGIFSP